MNKTLNKEEYIAKSRCSKSNLNIFSQYLSGNKLYSIPYKFLLMKLRQKSFYQFELPKCDGFTDIERLQLSDAYLLDMYQSSIDEFFSLQSILKSKISSIKSIGDLGGGIGRSSVFLRHMLNLARAKFFLIDANIDLSILKKQVNIHKTICAKEHTGYHNEHINYEKSGYNNLGITQQFFESNGMKNYELVNINEFANKPIKLDILYSFHSVGYHYSIKEAVTKLGLDDKLVKGGLAIFGVRKGLKQMDVNNYEIPKDIGKNFLYKGLVKGSNRQDFVVFEKV